MSKPVFEDLFNYREGRRNRKSLLLLMAAQTALSLAMMTVILVVVPNLGEIAQGVAGLIVFAIAIPVVLSQFVAMAQRCRDLGQTGWLVLLNFVPFVSLIFQIVLLIAPGNKGPNKYGEDPLEASCQAAKTS